MVDYSRYQAIKVEKKDKVALATLNRAERNPIDPDVHDELEDLLEDLGRDDEIDAIVLTGAGRVFSAGGNIKGMQARIADPSLPRTEMSACYRLINNFVNLEKPLIGAVNGHATGLGATIALFCDVVFLAENARIGDPHVSVGLVAGDGGSVIWPLLVGVARAKQYLMTGDLIDAKEAERIGLVNKVLPQEEVLPAAMAFAQRLANGPTKAISWTKQSINQHLKQAMNLVLPTSLATEFLSLQTADHEEAVNAFVEKRSPHFTGK
ncbi:MAG: hypothetical protein EPO21_24790 [Chloroflexota bacterium]|nr:MAG: hypothetical protein EPO21_24790 [Chloroflexota bacterium]